MKITPLHIAHLDVQMPMGRGKIRVKKAVEELKELHDALVLVTGTIQSSEIR